MLKLKLSKLPPSLWSRLQTTGNLKLKREFLKAILKPFPISQLKIMLPSSPCNERE